MLTVEPEIVTVYKQKSDGTLATLIPRSIRDFLGINSGDRFVVYAQENKIVLKLIESPRKQIAEASE